jgi:hypothetical protein
MRNTFILEVLAVNKTASLTHSLSLTRPVVTPLRYISLKLESSSLILNIIVSSVSQADFGQKKKL